LCLYVTGDEVETERAGEAGEAGEGAGGEGEQGQDQGGEEEGEAGQEGRLQAGHQGQQRPGQRFHGRFQVSVPHSPPPPHGVGHSHHFNADPDPASLYFTADPDPAFHFDADPDPPSLQWKSAYTGSIGLSGLHFRPPGLHL
jgi:hypothetical protein